MEIRQKCRMVLVDLVLFLIGFFLQTNNLVHVSSNRCLDVAKSKKYENGLVVANCTGSLSQQWKLEPVPWK